MQERMAFTSKVWFSVTPIPPALRFTDFLDELVLRSIGSLRLKTDGERDSDAIVFTTIARVKAVKPGYRVAWCEEYTKTEVPIHDRLLVNAKR